MNVFLTRVLFGAAVVVLMGCGTWLFFGIRSEAEGMGVPLAAVGFLVAYVFGLALVFFGIRYGEVVVNQGSVVLRFALAPQRVLPVREIDRAVYFARTVLPSRAGSSFATRLSFSLVTGRSAFISPRGSDIVRHLEGAGVEVEVVSDPVSLARARQLVPGSASLAESLIWPVFFAVTFGLPLAAFAWLFVTR